MEWLRTGDIYLVCKKLGHSSVTTTEIYTKFEESGLRKHFPIEASRLDGEGHSSYKLQLWKSLIDENASVVQW